MSHLQVHLLEGYNPRKRGSAVGVSLILELEHKVIQFYEMNSPIKIYGSKMVDALIRALPGDWSAVIIMDWSGGFWQKMKEEYDNIVIL